MDSEAGEVGPAAHVLMQPGASYVAEKCPDRLEHWTYRQRWPHSHCAVIEPYSRQTIFVTDLGQDKIFYYHVSVTRA